MQQNKENSFYVFNDKLFLTDIETTNTYIYFSFNFDQYITRIPIGDLDTKSIYCDEFYHGVCQSFESLFTKNVSIRSRLMSSIPHGNMEIIYNKQAIYSDVEHYVKKNVKRITQDGSLSYNLVNHKNSHCLQYSATIIEINNSNYIVLKHKNKVVHVVDDIPNISNLELDIFPDGSLYLLYTTTDEKYRTNKAFYRKYSDSEFISFREKLLLEELDDKFFIDIGRTKDNDLKYISINSKTTTEVHALIPTNDMDFELKCIQKRKEGSQYFFEYHKETETCYIITNNDPESDLDIFSVSRENLLKGEDDKTVLFTHKKGQTIHEIDIFSNFLVIYLIENSIPKLLKYNISTREFSYLPIPENTHYIEIGANLDYNGSFYNIKCHSLIRRNPILVKFDLKDDSATTLFNSHIIANDNLVTESIVIENNIPITILYDKTTVTDHSKCFLIGYGAYGTHLMEDLQIADNTLFYAYREYFLKRGYIFVYAHVRGGKENGIQWYKGGVKELKSNSMKDLKSVTNYLVNEKKLTRNGLFIGRGISAGGLLMMSTSLMYRNENIFNTLVLKVPFLDVLTTMLDESLPLTEHEFDEYGSPKESKEIAHLMMSYSPYHLIMQGKDDFNTNLYVTGSIDDFKCPLWNIAKTMAIIRKRNLTQPTNKHQVLKVHKHGHMDEVCTQTFYDDVSREILFIEKSFE
ncbi:predicted protein [Naegleria gruberi]|uniref:Prolyl endopeptidase-like n=1 Tax=Naegleria gruberi TaxID=5762 RepID=D2UYN1_NAEGR|nr:uncharacterized protein NAEGRDRAFT_61528 [Naegleria gruberi]EFC50822.1 predicted protein [Naegleria gruberi]|eukprot:XP_002683566.1 predicted protein [Naegleria gruberi strain NEG-M]